MDVNTRDAFVVLPFETADLICKLTVGNLISKLIILLNQLK